MSLIKNPNELVRVDRFAGLIYGEPGTGKSTLALSSPAPVMIDADNGMRRVQKRFQVPSLPMTSYKLFLDLLETNELDPFETIVPDTLGKFVDLIGDYLMEVDPKNRKRGGGLSQQGYGAIKIEFARIVREVKKKNKNLLFVAHGREEKDGEITKIRPDVAGASGKELVKELDFMGYMEMNGNIRIISFTPTERFYAKNSLSLPPMIEIPDPDKVGNVFVQKYIVDRMAQRQKDEEEENGKYDALIANLVNEVAKVVDGKTADEALSVINMAPVIWDSQRVAKHKLAEKVKAVGLVYDKATKAFVAAPTTQPTQQTQTSTAQPTTQANTAAPSTATTGQAAVTEQQIEDEFEKAKQKRLAELRAQTGS